VWRKKALAEYLFYRKHYRPETVRRIARAHRFREMRKILLTRFSLPFVRDRARALERMERYRVVYDIAIRESGNG
jgi:hypothetical protein